MSCNELGSHDGHDPQRSSRCPLAHPVHRGLPGSTRTLRADQVLVEDQPRFEEPQTGNTAGASGSGSERGTLGGEATPPLISGRSGSEFLRNCAGLAFTTPMHDMLK